MRRGSRVIVVLIGVGAFGAGCVGCVSDGPTRPVRVDQSRRPPTSAPPTEMFLAASQAVDLDGDNLPDTIPVTVYLFADPSRFTTPLWADGSFTFVLMDNAGVPVKDWTISGDRQRGGRLVLAPGPGYAFDLTLSPREVAGSEGGLYSIASSFEASGGGTIRTRGTATVRLSTGR